MSASRPAFALVLLLSLLAQGVALVGLALWNDTLVENYPPSMTATSGPATANAATSFNPVATEVIERPVGTVWAEWHAGAYGGWFGSAEAALLLIMVIEALGLALAAWLNLPFVHGSGAPIRSLARSFRASTGVLWPLTLFSLVWGGALVVLEHAELRAGAPSGNAGWSFLVLFSGLAALALLLVLWLRAAVHAVEPGPCADALPPRCEGCGYDLTHRPADGCCPECALPVDTSLVESASRPGSRWSRRRTPASWLATWRQVLFQPRAFYRALKLRTPLADTAGFAGWNYVLLGLGAAAGGLLWLACVWSRQGLPPTASDWRAIAVRAPGSICFGVLGCWFGHRAVGALVFAAWVLAGRLCDYRWAAKVVVYESAFLWAFCLFWGLMITSFVAHDDWISRSFGVSTPFGPPLLEFAALGLGTAILFALWLVRYEIAYRSIRWGNF